MNGKNGVFFCTIVSLVVCGLPTYLIKVPSRPVAGVLTANSKPKGVNGATYVCQEVNIRARNTQHRDSLVVTDLTTERALSTERWLVF